MSCQRGCTSIQNLVPWGMVLESTTVDNNWLASRNTQADVPGWGPIGCLQTGRTSFSSTEIAQVRRWFFCSWISLTIGSIRKMPHRDSSLFVPWRSSSITWVHWIHIQLLQLIVMLRVQSNAIPRIWRTTSHLVEQRTYGQGSFPSQSLTGTFLVWESHISEQQRRWWE